MALSATLGSDLVATILSVVPGCSVALRLPGGTEISAWRCTAQVQQANGQYGSSAGASATMRVGSSSIPAGESLTDGAYIELYEGGEWRKYRVNGLAQTLGMYRFELSDAMQ